VGAVPQVAARHQAVVHPVEEEFVQIHALMLMMVPAMMEDQVHPIVYVPMVLIVQIAAFVMEAPLHQAVLHRAVAVPHQDLAQVKLLFIPLMIMVVETLQLVLVDIPQNQFHLIILAAFLVAGLLVVQLTH
jgi:hypothetical protein